jgi:hypothetical protein
MTKGARNIGIPIAHRKNSSILSTSRFRASVGWPCFYRLNSQDWARGLDIAKVASRDRAYFLIMWLLTGNFPARSRERPICISERCRKQAQSRVFTHQRKLADFGGLVMILAHPCYDQGCGLRTFLRAKNAREGTRTPKDFSTRS